jgi:hypothetical protein
MANAWMGIVILTIADGLVLSLDLQYEPSHTNNKSNDDAKRAFGPVIPIIIGAAAEIEKIINDHDKLFIVLSTAVGLWSSFVPRIE